MLAPEDEEVRRWSLAESHCIASSTMRDCVQVLELLSRVNDSKQLTEPQREALFEDLAQ